MTIHNSLTLNKTNSSVNKNASELGKNFRENLLIERSISVGAISAITKQLVRLASDINYEVNVKELINSLTRNIFDVQFSLKGKSHIFKKDIIGITDDYYSDNLNIIKTSIIRMFGNKSFVRTFNTLVRKHYSDGNLRLNSTFNLEDVSVNSNFRLIMGLNSMINNSIKSFIGSMVSRNPEKYNNDILSSILNNSNINLISKVFMEYRDNDIIMNNIISPLVNKSDINLLVILMRKDTINTNLLVKSLTKEFNNMYRSSKYDGISFSKINNDEFYSLLMYISFENICKDLYDKLLKLNPLDYPDIDTNSLEELKRKLIDIKYPESKINTC